MINSILQERKPEDKPRFFLHDEVKAWLGDNLQINIRVSPNYSCKWDLQNKLQQYQIYNPLLIGFSLESSVLIDGETIQLQGSNTLMLEMEQLASLLVTRLEMYDNQIKHLNATNEHLARRIELLENPIPL